MDAIGIEANVKAVEGRKTVPRGMYDFTIYDNDYTKLTKWDGLVTHGDSVSDESLMARGFLFKMASDQIMMLRKIC
jgi:hypothetical protein